MQYLVTLRQAVRIVGQQIYLFKILPTCLQHYKYPGVGQMAGLKMALFSLPTCLQHCKYPGVEQMATCQQRCKDLDWRIPPAGVVMTKTFDH